MTKRIRMTFDHGSFKPNRPSFQNLLSLGGGTVLVVLLVISVLRWIIG